MTHSGRWVWVGAGLLLAYVAAYAAVTSLSGSPAKMATLDLMIIGAALAAACFCALAAARAHDRFMRWYWSLLATAGLCLTIAEAIWAVHELVLGDKAPYLSAADVAWLAFYPLVYAAMMKLPAARAVKRSTGMVFLLDGMLAAAVGAALIWEFLLDPVIHPGATPLANVTALGYCILDLLLVGAYVSLALSAARRTIPRGTTWLIASLTIMLVADTVYARMIVTDTYATGAWVDPLWALSYALLGIAALAYVQGRARGNQIESQSASSFARAGVGLGGLIHSYSPYAAVVASGFILYNHFVTNDSSGTVASAVAIALSTLIPVLVLTRQLVFTAQHYRLRVSLVEASQALEERVNERTRELEAEKERLAILNHASKQISHCASVQEILEAGAAILSQAAHCTSVALSAPGQRGSLRFASPKQLPEASESQLRKVLRKFLLSNADNTDDTPILVDGRGTPNSGNGDTGTPAGPFVKMMVFPMVYRQVTLGAACMATDQDDCRLSEGELELVSNIVSQVAVALEGACRYDDARYLADNDALTGIANRRHIIECLNREVARSGRAGASFSLVMMDVDRFKFFNDTYGHEVGDQVLVTVARALQEALRGIDTLGRFGGDEFLAILPDTDREGARRVVERIGECLADHPVAVKDALPLALRLSCGIAVFPQNGRSTHELFHVADANMYRAKNSNAGRTVAAKA